MFSEFGPAPSLESAATPANSACGVHAELLSLHLCKLIDSLFLGRLTLSAWTGNNKAVTKIRSQTGSVCHSMALFRLKPSIYQLGVRPDEPTNAKDLSDVASSHLVMSRVLRLLATGAHSNWWI